MSITQFTYLLNRIIKDSLVELLIWISVHMLKTQAMHKVTFG